jgi:type I restriction enzyme S subunit
MTQANRDARFHRAPSPPGWQRVPLGEVGEIASGVTLGRRLRGGRTRNVPYLRVANVKDAHLDLSDVYEIEATEEEIENLRLRVGDLLLTEGGDADKLGRGTLWRGELPLCIHQNHIFRVRFDPDRFCPEFIAAEIASPYGKAYFLAHAKQTTGIATINQRVLAGFALIAPPITEQQRIASTLIEQMAIVVRARDAAEARIEAANTLCSSYLHEIFNGPGARKWARRGFGEVARISAYQVDPTLPEFRDLPHVNGEIIEAGTCRLKNVTTAAEDRMTSGKYLFEPGAVLYSKLRPYLRKAVLVDFRGVCSADMYPLTVDEAALDRRFVMWTLVSDEFTEYAINHSQRARMPKLNRDQLFAWQCPVPPLPEQRRLMDWLTSRIEMSEKLVAEVKQQRDAIDALPGALLRQAFIGVY